MSSVAVRSPRRVEKSRLRPGIFLPFVLAFLLLAGVAIYGALKPNNASLPAPGQRGSLVWGDGVFANRAELRAWLSLHGSSYQAWAPKHPAARALVPPATSTHAKRRAAATSKKATPTSAPALVPAAAPTSTGRDWTHILTWVAVVAGILLGLLAAVPNRFARGMGLSWLAEERDLRLGVAGAGAALLVGVALATVLA